MRDNISNENFTNVKTIFCDHFPALQWAFNRGLSKNIIVKTSSPRLLLDANINTVNLEKNWTSRKILNFQNSVKNTSRLIYKKLITSENFSHSEALLASSEFISSMVTVYKGACLTKKDLSEPRALITFKSDRSRDAFLYPYWMDLLRKNIQFKKVIADIKPLNFSGLNAKNVKFFDRIYIAGHETIIYMISLKIMKLIKLFGFYKGKGLIFRPHEILKEVAASLFLKGYLYQEYIPEKSEIFNNANKLKFTEVYEFKEIDEIIQKFLKLWLDPVFISQSKKLIKKQISNIIYQMKNIKELMKKDKNLEDLDFIMTGPLTGVYGRCLSDIAINRKIPIISLNHGITHEISNAPNIFYSAYDTNFADLTLTHTDLGAKAVRNQPYARAVCKAIGLPSRALRLKNFKKKENKFSIVYISTNINNGNERIPLIGLENEWDKAKRELNFIKEVLSKLPHEIAFKPYPEETRKFLDENITTTYAEKTNKIKVVGRNYDARFLVKNYDMIITSGATSTLGWLMTSDKPLIFINWRNHLPLKKEVVKTFRSGVFYFEGDSVNFNKKIIEFLNISIEDLNKKWQQKSEAREKLFTKYISKYKKNIGLIGADEVIKFLRKFNKRMK